MPMCWRTLLMSVPGAVMSCPLKKIWPPVGVSSRFKQRRKVDLPEPEGPMMAIFSPGEMVSVMLFSTGTPPKDLVRFLTSITLCQPPFHLLLNLGDADDEHQIDDGRQIQRNAVEGDAADAVRGFGQIAHRDVAGHAGFL